MTSSTKKYSLLHFLIVIYLVAAFSWWAILLYQKNEEHYQLQTALMQYDSNIDSALVQSKYQKQKKMIMGEGLVFALSILIGLLLIYRAFRKELQLNQTLNDFLLSVTHELKTPIATLKLVNETLRNKNLPKEKVADLLNTGWEESLRLEGLVNNILTAAQIEQQYKFNFESVDTTELINNRISRFQKIFPERQIEFQGQAGLVVHADIEAFNKVIDNLIHNAIKYSPAEKPIKINSEEAGKHINISITDYGSGIPKGEQEKIWQKFYRIGNEETRDNQGTGLGLWLSKQILKAHKGNIVHSPNKPQGSTFKIIIPTSS